MKCWYRPMYDLNWHKGELKTDDAKTENLNIVCQEPESCIPNIQCEDVKSVIFGDTEMTIVGYFKAHNSKYFEKIYVDVRFSKPKEVK